MSQNNFQPTIAPSDQLTIDDAFAQALSNLHSDLSQHPEWNFHSFLITRNGQLVFEEYYPGTDQKWGRDVGRIDFNRDTLHDVRSVTKSVVSTLIGVAIDEGLIRSTSQPLSDFFPEYDFPGGKADITLKHALSMTTGLAWDELNVIYGDPSNDCTGMFSANDRVEFILNKPLVAAPGELFNYSGGATELLAAALQRATQIPLREYFEQKLWLPLGGSGSNHAAALATTKPFGVAGSAEAGGYEWSGPERGTIAAESGLRMRPIDLMKFANLFVNQGQHGDKQIVPAAWIAMLSQNQVKHSPDQLSNFPRAFSQRFIGYKYSYQWWLPKVEGVSPGEVFAAFGLGGQAAIIFPKARATIVTTAGRYKISNAFLVPLIEKHLVPVLR